VEYILLTIFAIGLLLFLLSWLRVIFAGFRHHVVTGLVSIIPVLNLLILPTIWHKVSVWVLAGIVGLLAASGSWYLGADKSVHRVASDSGFALPMPGAASQQGEGTADQKVPAAPEPQTQSLSPPPRTTTGTELPRSALYSMRFQSIEADALDGHDGNYIRIFRNDHKRLEGTLLRHGTHSLTIQYRINGNLTEQDISIKDVERLEVMARN